MDSHIQREAQHYRDQLDQLLRLFGSRDEAALSRMISLIRSGASQQEILVALYQYTEDNRRRGDTEGSSRDDEGRQR